MSEALVIHNLSERSIAYSPSAHELREAILASSALISTISSPEQNDEATQIVAAQKRFLAMFEEARVAAKLPALEECRGIDGLSKKFVAEVESEVLRVHKLMGDWITLQEAKRRDEELSRRKDLEELERQKRAAMAAATTHEEREAAVERFDGMAASVVAPAPVELPRGQSARADWEWTVEDIHALYRAFPHAVKLEARRTEIRELLIRNNGVVPGVVAKAVIKANVRPERAEKPLEIGQ